MAEARRAVEPLPALSLETPIDPTKHSVQIHQTGVGTSIFIPNPRILARNAWRTFKQGATKIEHAFAPFPTPLIVSIVVGGVVWTVTGTSDSTLRNGVLGNALWKLDTNYNFLLPLVERYRGSPVPVGVRVGYLAIFASSGIVLAYASTQRFILRNLLAYSGWMDELRAKKKSYKTVVWALLLNFVYIRGGSTGKTGSSVVIGPNPTNDPVIEKYRSQKQGTRGGGGGVMKKLANIVKRFMWAPPASTQSYQTSLPAQPVPSIEDTLKRYCQSMAPLIQQQQELPADSPQKNLIAFSSMEDLESRCKAFLASEGPTLQRYLHWKFVTSPNYVSDWWMKFVYLRGRDSLMINSNYYGTSIYKEVPTNNQAARAAFYTHTLGQLVKEVAKERIPPLVIQGMVPMCMDQYKPAFGTTRIPGKDCDRLVTLEYRETFHIVVMHRGKIYKMPLYHPKTGKLLEPCQLEVAFTGILRDSASSGSDAVEGAMIGSLTAWNRGLWAEARESFFLPHRANRTSLKVIERALFVVCLDHESDNDLLAHASNPAAAALTRSNPRAKWDDLTGLGNNFMHGNGANRWFDKSLNIIVTPTGYTGMNGEHTWADATTLGHLWEIVLARETYSSPYSAADGGSIADRAALGEGGGKPATNFFPAQRLHFSLSAESSLIAATPDAIANTTTSPTDVTTTTPVGIAPTLAATIRNAYNASANQIADLDLIATRFGDFGKGNIKKAKCSPDAFIQMALQIAFYKQRGFFVQTYESASARLYRDGRTETIRSCSQESCDFVRTFLNYKETDGPDAKSHLQKLLRVACEKHVHTSTLAGSGRGVDRHLFAMYVVSVGTETDSPFLQSVMKHGWKLSTSQIPQQQANNEWLPGHNGDLIPRPSGGFGPVADDGYGVSYVICGEDSFFFHVSSKRSCPDTDSTVFRDAIFDALHKMNSLF